MEMRVVVPNGARTGRLDENSLLADAVTSRTKE
jgi:hypothetical protein